MFAIAATHIWRDVAAALGDGGDAYSVVPDETIGGGSRPATAVEPKYPIRGESWGRNGGREGGESDWEAARGL